MAKKKKVATRSPTVICKVENIFNKLGDIAKEISRQSVRSAAWLLLAAYRMQGECLKGRTIKYKGARNCWV